MAFDERSMLEHGALVLYIGLTGKFPRIFSFSKYPVNFCFRDAINAFACWIHFVSTDASTDDHTSDSSLAHLELLGGFGCG